MFEQPDHFDWLSSYLQRRGFGPTARRTLATVGALMTLLLPVNVIWGGVSISRPVALIVAAAIVCSGVCSLAVWWTRWPTQRQSIVLGIAGSIATAAWCLVQHSPVFGLLACSVLVIPGGYIAVFHSARYMLLTSTLAVIVGAVQATRLALDSQVVTAITGCLLVVEINVAVPLAMLIVVRALMADLTRADSDPLTGLLNRRAFTRAALGRLQAATCNSVLAVAVVDLDRFKVINDHFGHAGGDAALVTVAGALRSAGGETAVLGRMGGEEFVVADIVSTAETETPTAWGTRLRDAVAATTFPVTASVGISTSVVNNVDADTAEEVLRHAIARADDAMYRAKRLGGNQAHE